MRPIDEDVENDAAYYLLRPEEQAEDAVDRRDAHAAQCGPRETAGEAAGRQHCPDPAKGPREHHALELDVDDACLLGEELTHRREDQRRGQCNRRDQEKRDGIEVHGRLKYLRRERRRARFALRAGVPAWQ